MQELIEKAKNRMIDFYESINGNDFEDRCPCTHKMRDGGYKTDEFSLLCDTICSKTGLDGCGICEHVFGEQMVSARINHYPEGYGCPCNILGSKAAFKMLEKFVKERTKCNATNSGSTPTRTRRASTLSTRTRRT
jgi:hypothetical protein